MSLIVFAVYGCGGGGGRANEGVGISLEASVDSLTLRKTVADTLTPLQIFVSVRNWSTEVLYHRFESVGGGFANAGYQQTSSGRGEILVTFPVPGNVTPGTSTGSFDVSVCRDPQCQQHIGGSPLRIPVELTVTGIAPIASVSEPASISVSAAQGEPSPEVELTIRFAAPVLGTPYVEMPVPALATDATFEMSSPTTARVHLTMRKAETLYPGVVARDFLTLDLCYASTCANRVFTETLRVPLAYEVRHPDPLPEPVIDQFVPISVGRLMHDVIDAEYAAALDSIVMVAAHPTNALYVYQIAAQTERLVDLAAAPTSVSLTPDGLYAAVAHDNTISYVVLADVGDSAAPLPRVLTTSASIGDVVADGRSRVHVFPSDGPFVEANRSVDVSTGAEILSAHSNVVRARLHPSGDYIYAATTRQSPDDILKLDVASLPLRYLYDSPYHGTPEMCRDVWISEEGAYLYTRCGARFRTAADQANDMVLAGLLQLSQSPAGPVPMQIRSLSHSAEVDEVALIEFDGYVRSCDYDPLDCYTRLSLHRATSLQRVALYSIPPLEAEGRPQMQLGRFVFHSANGGRRFVITELLGVSNAAEHFYISEF